MVRWLVREEPPCIISRLLSFLFADKGGSLRKELGLSLGGVMARIDWMGEMIGPIAVGIISAGAAVVEKQAVQRGTGGQFMQQASLWGDVLIGGYALPITLWT